MEQIGKDELLVQNFLSQKSFIKKKLKNLKNSDTWSTKMPLLQNLLEKNVKKKKKKKRNWPKSRQHKLLLRRKNKNKEIEKLLNGLKRAELVYQKRLQKKLKKRLIKINLHYLSEILGLKQMKLNLKNSWTNSDR